MKNYPDEQLVLVTTGSQGESMAALSRMAASIHKKVSIQPVIRLFSARSHSGNEKAVSKVINELSAKGADVIFQDVHVSGHPCQEEIKLIYSLVKPKYAIPVHGEYRHLKAQAKVALELGIPKENVLFFHPAMCWSWIRRARRDGKGSRRSDYGGWSGRRRCGEYRIA